MFSPVRTIFSKAAGTIRCLSLFFLLQSILSAGQVFAQQTSEASRPSSSAPDNYKLFEFLFEPDAYYTDVELIISLSKTPIPQLGELQESEIYTTLLSRAALLPQFLVFEASVNPMPYFGTYLKEHDRDFYDNARISGNFNWVKALTAGFEEPYAFSLLAGNVVNFDIPGVRNIKGIGYSGYLFSAGNYHIKDNELIRDEWREFEWKMKGDRKSPVKKLSWSFRIGAKLHGNPDITDIIYLSFRRSRVDYKTEEESIFNNSGFEYSFDMDRRTLSSIRHYFYLDKKWPLENKQIAFALAAGFVWESARKYTGVLAAGRQRDDFQFILRPNIEF
jgi:hypothetical protein